MNPKDDGSDIKVISTRSPIVNNLQNIFHSTQSRIASTLSSSSSSTVSSTTTTTAVTTPTDYTNSINGTDEEKENPFKRELGVWDLTSIGVGGIIGAGVYVLTGKAAALYAGPAVALSFLFSGTACLFSALCYSELASMIPASGSAYSFATATLGQFIGWIIGWDLMLEYLFGASTVAVGWSGYMCSLLKDMRIPCAIEISEAPYAYNIDNDSWIKTGGIFNLPAVLVTLLMTYIQIKGIRESTRFNSIIVGIKVGVLIIFIIAGLGYIKTDNWSPFIPDAVDTWRYGFGGILRGSSWVFFAYIGFDAISTAAQEAKNPQKTVPQATLISLAVCTGLYIIVGLVITGIISYKDLNVADPIAVALDAAGGDSLNWLRPIVKIGAILGLTSVVLVQILGQTRIFYSMATDGLLPPIFARVHPQYRTPHISTWITGITASIIAGLLPIDVLGEMVSIGTLFAFAVVCCGVIALRIRQPNLRRPFRAPFYPYVPLLGILTSVGQMIALPGASWLRLFIWMVIGTLIYLFYGRNHATGHEAKVAKLLNLAQLHVTSPSATNTFSSSSSSDDGSSTPTSPNENHTLTSHQRKLSIAGNTVFHTANLLHSIDNKTTNLADVYSYMDNTVLDTRSSNNNHSSNDELPMIMNNSSTLPQVAQNSVSSGNSVVTVPSPLHAGMTNDRQQRITSLMSTSDNTVPKSTNTISSSSGSTSEPPRTTASDW